MTSGPCPDENALVRFSSGKLSGVDLGSVEQHLDGCSACRTLIAQLASLHSKTLETPGSALSSPPLQGKVGRYQVERLLGGGGMGMVYAGRDRELNRVVAIKVLKTTAGPGGDAEPRARLLREAQTMAKLSHPNLVPIFELGTDRGDDFLAMELIDGPTLDFWLREKKRTWKEIVAVFLDAGRGLEAAHQAGVVHRDFKPANVLIGPDGRARVTDFGLARPRLTEGPGVPADASIELTREGALLGTPAYMSPEQLEGQVADVRSDQFGFCVALVEALVGHRPFSGRTPAELREGMRARKPPQFELSPARLKKALLKGMALSPDARFPSMTALLAELEAIVRPARSRVTPVVAAAAVRALLIGVVASRIDPPARASPAPAAEARAILLTVGETRTFALATVQRVQSVDDTLVRVALVGNQQVVLTGLRPGKTDLVLLTRADPHVEQVPVTWTIEIGDDGGRNFRMQVGEARTLAVPGLTTIENESEAIARARISGKDQINIDGVATGATVLKTFVRGRDAPLLWQIEVAARVKTPLTLAVGEKAELSIPGLARIAIGEAEIADVATLGNGRVRVTAKKVGTTTLIAWSRTQPPKDDTRSEWEITVEEPAGSLTLRPGTQKVLSIPGLQRVAVGDASVVDVKTIGNSQLLLIAGADEGKTTLLAWKADGTRVGWTLTVARKAEPAPRAVPAIPAPSPLEATTPLSVGEQKVFRIAGMQRVAVGDSEIADVKTLGNDQLLVVAQGVGRTTLLVWKNDGTRVSTLLEVDARPLPPDVADVFTLIEGETIDLPIEGLSGVKADPAGVVKASRSGKDTLRLTGVAAGKAKVEVSKTGRSPETLEVHVQTGGL